MNSLFNETREGGCLQSFKTFMPELAWILNYSVELTLCFFNARDLFSWNPSTHLDVTTMNIHSLDRSPSDLYHCIKLANGYIATGDSDGRITIVDPLDFRIVTNFKLNDYHVNFISELSDGTLVVASDDSNIFFLNVSSGYRQLSVRNVFCGHTKFVESVIEIRRDFIVSAGFDKKLCLWDINKGLCTMKYRGHTKGIMCLLKLWNGNFVSAGHDKVVFMWNMYQETPLFELRGHSDMIILSCGAYTMVKFLMFLKNKK
jgi:WD40 repeat protein